jgi:hypothetical protein
VPARVAAPWRSGGSSLRLAWLALGSAFASASFIVADIWLRGYRQKMRVMEAVWPVTGLYFGALAIWGYRRFGRPRTQKWLDDRGETEPPNEPRWATIGTGVSHCGAGCTLGDIIAEFAVFGLGLTIAGKSLYPEFIGDYLLAVGWGLAFQYFAIAPMRGLGLRKCIAQAAQADFLSLSAFEVGLFGWMALMPFVFFPNPQLHPDSPVYWFLMQIGMIIGFFTAWPANVWLINHGVKEAM